MEQTKSQNECNWPGPVVGNFLNNICQQAKALIHRPSSSEAIEILKRLQREAFLDLMKMRDKLEIIEKRFTHHALNNQASSLGGTKTQFKGDIKTGGAFILTEHESSQQLYSSLDQARMKTGIEVKFTFETFFRERDLLVTECVAGQSCTNGSNVVGGPFTLSKVLYSAHFNDYLSLSVVPLGAKGKDIAASLNPLQDHALTGFADTGPDLFRHCQGSAIGATIKGPNLAISAGKYLSGWGAHPSGSASAVCSGTLGQVLFQPLESTIFAFSGLNGYLQSPPHPLSKALDWGNIGPLIFSNACCKGTNSLGASSSISSAQYPSLPSLNSNSKRISTQSVAFSAEAEFNESMQIGGWLQADREDWLCRAGTKSLQWALCLSKFPENGFGWGLSIGKSREDPFSMQRSQEMHPPDAKHPVSQILLEAFAKIPCGKGFTLQPGLLYMTNGNARTPAFMLRASWSL